MNGRKLSDAYDPNFQARREDPIRQAVVRDARIVEMVDRWQRKLNLLNWDIRFDPAQVTNPEHDAHVRIADAQTAAVVGVHPKLDYQAAELSVVHELLHLVLREWALQAARLLVHVQDDVSRVHLQEMMDEAEERAVEDIARALVPAAPRVNPATREDPSQERQWAVFS